jgi:hypothetical protein
MRNRFNLRPFPHDTSLFFGGGGPSAPPTPPPPVRESALDIRETGREQKRFRKKRSSKARSLLGAGNTGGFAPAGTKSLLGE